MVFAAEQDSRCMGCKEDRSKLCPFYKTRCRHEQLSKAVVPPPAPIPTERDKELED